MNRFFIKTGCRRSREKICPGFALRTLLTAVLVFVLLGTQACKQPAKPGSAAPAPATDKGIHKTYERGPVTCHVDTDKSEMTIADRLNLTITAIADPGIEVELPATGEKLSQFGIVDYHTASPELTKDGKTKISRSYVLEPFLSGGYTIPAMTVHFWKTGEKGKEDHSLETEEIPITVKSLLAENLKDMKLHEIRPPVGLPRSLALWIWIAGICGGLAIVGLGAVAVIRRRRKALQVQAEIYLTAHERAYMELQRLVAEDLIGKGEIKAFYQEISAILRRYIENRFGIHAPEQTTEEFLTGLKIDATFPEKYHGLLKDFLKHCDLVKFADLQPTTDEIQKTFDSCKTFIEETKSQ